MPTVQEAGFKGFEATAWYAIVAPTGTPPDIVRKVNNAVNAFLNSDKGKIVLEQNALQGVGGSPEDLKAFIDGELAKWAARDRGRQDLDVAKQGFVDDWN